MNSLVSYDFEERAVRVVMIAGDPWFVANDIAAVLGYKSFHMVRMLDEDEKGIHIMDTLGGRQELLIISESGMYSAIFRSRRAEAQRFRKWVTSDVLPSIRRTGRYELPGLGLAPPAPQVPGDFDATRLSASVNVVREARRLFGPRSARNIWAQLGLPMSISDSSPTAEGDPLAEPLKDWIDGKGAVTIEECCAGIGLVQVDLSVRHRIGALLRMFGWSVRVARRGRSTVKLWSAPETRDFSHERAEAGHEA